MTQTNMPAHGKCSGQSLIPLLKMCLLCLCLGIYFSLNLLLRVSLMFMLQALTELAYLWGNHGRKLMSHCFWIMKFHWLNNT